MWKTHPQILWMSDCLIDSSVDSVEKLSTGIVEKCYFAGCYVDDVEKLSTGIVENRKKAMFSVDDVEKLSTGIVEKPV